MLWFGWRGRIRTFDLLIQSQAHNVEGTVRPTGVGRAITTYNMPIEGRDEWIAAARQLA
jgi:hypothetical protein